MYNFDFPFFFSLNRYEEELPVDAVIDWFAIAILN